MKTKSNIIVAIAIIAVGFVGFISGKVSSGGFSSLGDKSTQASVIGRTVGVESVGKEGSDVAQSTSTISNEEIKPVGAPEAATSSSSGFVASKNGKKYFPVGCKYAKSIKKENQIFFGSEHEAQGTGRVKSLQCK